MHRIESCKRCRHHSRGVPLATVLGVGKHVRIEAYGKCSRVVPIRGVQHARVRNSSSGVGGVPNDPGRHTCLPHPHLKIGAKEIIKVRPATHGTNDRVIVPFIHRSFVFIGKLATSKAGMGAGTRHVRNAQYPNSCSNVYRLVCVGASNGDTKVS